MIRESRPLSSVCYTRSAVRSNRRPSAFIGGFTFSLIAADDCTAIIVTPPFAVAKDGPPNPRRRGFTLIEMLVVVAIVGLLVSLLVPSLTRAREQTRQVTCKSNLHQIGTAIMSYAYPAGVIPFGPDVQGIPPMLEANDGSKATNQIWTGPQTPATSNMALGLLMSRAFAFPELLYCPADDSSDPIVEWAKVRQRRPEPGFCSYFYRQLDETTGRGRIENLGRNSANQKAVALAMDMNSVVTFNSAYYRTNHKAHRVNVLYLDASILSFDNEKNPFSIRDEDFFAPPPGPNTSALDARRDQILQAADAGYNGRRP